MEDERTISVTCPSCRITIVPPRARTMCPFCGSFYDQEANSDVSLRRRQSDENIRLPHIENSNGNQQRSLVRLTGFGPMLTDGLGLIHTYITGIVMRPPSQQNNVSTSTTNNGPGNGSTFYVSLPPIRTDAAGQMVTTMPSSASRQPLCGTGNGRTLSQAGRELSAAAPVMDDIGIITYPEKLMTAQKFREEVEMARASGEYSMLQEYYEVTFGSLVDLVATFKSNPDQEEAKLDDPDIKTDLLNETYEALEYLPSFICKAVLKGLVTTLLSPCNRLKIKDETRAVYILLQNPVLCNQASYVVLAHLLRKTVALNSGDHQLLIHWFARLEAECLRKVVKCLLQFITIREFPPANGHKLPSINKSRWWIPCATRVLALLNAANNKSTPNTISYTEFYNSALDHINLMAEYYRWQNPSKHSKFSYCQYPYILSIVAKKTILQRDSEQQMILNARRSLLNRALFRQIPDIDVFFLNLNVRRSHLVSDSLNEIASKQCDLKKKLKVTFVGEPGLDMGGLTKEWFLLVIKQIFDSNYGMFVYHNKARCYWFSTSQNGNLREYNLIGVASNTEGYFTPLVANLCESHACVIASNNTEKVLDGRDHIFLNAHTKLLSPPVVPQHLESSSVGLCKFTMEDFAEVMPDVAVGLRELLVYEGCVEEDFCMNFQVSVEEFGQVKTHILKPDGENIPVTNTNRQEFVDLYMDLILNKAIYQAFKAFYLGFHSVCASNALIMLRPEEVEMLVCGSPTLDMEELRKVTIYDGFQENEPYMKEFWEIMKSFSCDLQKQFLRFATGSDRVPVGGMGEMTFKISALNHNTEMLPISHTCFNQLVLPRYKSREILREKLVIAISNAEGFGLE